VLGLAAPSHQEDRVDVRTSPYVWLPTIADQRITTSGLIPTSGPGHRHPRASTLPAMPRHSAAQVSLAVRSRRWQRRSLGSLRMRPSVQGCIGMNPILFQPVDHRIRKPASMEARNDLGESLMPNMPPMHRATPSALVAHTPPSSRSSASARGYDRRWRRLRLMVLARQPLCADPFGFHAADEHIEVATEVDHIVPKSRGGRDVLVNLQGLCASCHSRKTAQADGGCGRKPRGEDWQVGCRQPPVERISAASD
jgi:5-methylcytosine-specific restriction enzyme A